jgi:hypothetical protein
MSVVVESGWLEQVDRGAFNPHRNIPDCHETCKGGQGPTLSCCAIDDDDDDINSKSLTIMTNIISTRHRRMIKSRRMRWAGHLASMGALRKALQRRQVGDLGVRGRILLKWILNKEGVILWLGLKWLGIGSSGGLSSNSAELNEFLKVNEVNAHRGGHRVRPYAGMLKLRKNGFLRNDFGGRPYKKFVCEFKFGSYYPNNYYFNETQIELNRCSKQLVIKEVDPPR